MRRTLITVVLTGLVGTPALAAAGAPPSAADRRTAAPPEAAPLSGPRVRLTEAPGVYMSFGGEGGPRMVRANLRLYAGILRQMDLTEEQRWQADLIGAEYAQAMREFQETRGPEQRRLQQRLARLQGATRPEQSDAAPTVRPRRDAVENDQSNERAAPRRTNDQPPPGARDAGPPPRRGRDADSPARPAPMPSEAEAAMGSAEAIMARLAEIRRAVPPQEPYMLRLHDLLSEEQKAEFEQRLAQHFREQAEIQMQRRLAAAGRESPPEGEAGEMMPGMVRAEEGRIEIDESQLTPPMRERLRRLREERRRLLEDRDRANPRPPSHEEIEFEDQPPAPRPAELERSGGDEG